MPATAELPVRERGGQVAGVDTGARLHEQVAETWRALLEGNDPQHPQIMSRGGRLVRVTDNGLVAWMPETLKVRMSEVAAFGALDSTGKWREKSPPVEVARALLDTATPYATGAPEVDKVTDVPVLLSTGEIAAAGYHAEDRLYYRPAAGLEDLDVSGEPDHHDVWEARELIVDELLGDFGFATDADQANALGLLLLPFIRDSISGPTPLHVINAPEPGTGKTALAEVLLAAGCAWQPGPEVKSDDEMRKRITAELMESPGAIVFDNVAGRIEGSALAAVITAPTWRDRRLGASESVTLPVRNVWVATGNNVQASRELARRTVFINLEPGEVNPTDRDQREFRHPNIVGWAREHRRDLVSAALALVKHWAAGEAHGVRLDGRYNRDEYRFEPEVNMGSFNEWATVVGGIVGAAGVPGFLGNLRAAAQAADIETEEAVAFLTAWHDHHGDRPMTASALTEWIVDGGARDTLPDELQEWAGSPSRLVKSLRYWLRSRNGRRFAGLELKGTPPANRKGGETNTWTVS